MAVHVNWNPVKYPIKVTVCLLWMLQPGLGAPQGERVSAAYLHDMIVNVTGSLFRSLARCGAVC